MERPARVRRVRALDLVRAGAGALRDALATRSTSCSARSADRERAGVRLQARLDPISRAYVRSAGAPAFHFRLHVGSSAAWLALILGKRRSRRGRAPASSHPVARLFWLLASRRPPCARDDAVAWRDVAPAAQRVVAPRGVCAGRARMLLQDAWRSSPWRVLSWRVWAGDLGRPPFSERRASPWPRPARRHARHAPISALAFVPCRRSACSQPHPIPLPVRGPVSSWHWAGVAGSGLAHVSAAGADWTRAARSTSGRVPRSCRRHVVMVAGGGAR